LYNITRKNKTGSC